MLTNATITRKSGGTGVTAPSAVGVLAIVAGAAAGTENLPQQMTRTDVAATTFVNGRLLEYFSIVVEAAQKPAVLVRATTSTAAAYGAIVHTGVAGTAVPTAGATAPIEDYQATVTFMTGCTVGVAGGTYTYSLDGGQTASALQQLGTATTLTLNLPASAGGGSSGVSFTLTATQTFLAGDTFSCLTTGPRMTGSDTTAALEALRVTQAPFEAVYLDEEYQAGLISTFDQWIQSQWLVGKFYLGLCNTRGKHLPAPATESEATFLTAQSAIAANDATDNVSVGYDMADVASTITGLVLPRPAGILAGARAMKIPVGESPNFVGRGALDGDPDLTDAATGVNPKWHNEEIYPGADDARFLTLRSRAGRQGVFINQPRILSSSTSDFQGIQHARIMNAACTAAFPLLTDEVGKAVGKKPPNPTTGAINILESDAQAIEQYVTEGVRAALKGQVVDVVVTLARDDEIGSNAPAVIHAFIEVEAFAYIGSLPTTASFVRSIPITVTPAVAA